MPQNHYLVPEHFQGAEKNIEHTIITGTTEDAEDGFVDAKERLLDVNNWSMYTGPDIHFELADAHDKLLNRKAHKGDFIKMEAPDVAPAVVGVEAIEYDDYPDEGRETFAIRLKPGINNPETNVDQHNATATIVIDRRHKKLTASYHGRNEAGAWFSLSDELLSDLVKGFVA